MGSWLFGSKTQTVNDPPTPASALRIQTSMQGRPIAILWGTNRIAGNLIWQGGFTAIPITQTTSTGTNNWFEHIFTKAQSTTTVTGYNYTTSLIFALCYGTITAVLRAWNGTTSTDTASLGFVTYFGTNTQTAWSTPPVNQQLNYREIAYVADATLNLGSQPSLPIINFEVETTHIGYGPDGLDANPEDVVSDILTNTYYGVNFPSARLNLDVMNYSGYAAATGMTVSPVLTEQTPVQTFLNDLMMATNSTFRWSSGKLSIVPFGTSSITANGAIYTASITPVYNLSADDFLTNQGGSSTGTSTNEPVTFVRKRKSDMLNVIKVEYLDRSLNYDPVAIDAKDEGSIDFYGARPSGLKARHMFTNGTAAQQSAYLELIANQISGSYTFTLPPKYILLDVEDIVTLTRPTMGMVLQPVRITEIQENADYSLTFTAEEFLGTSSTPGYDFQGNTAINTDFLASPGNVVDHIIFHPPDGLAAPATGETAIWLAACGSDSVNYAGCTVWYSTDAVNFNVVGIIPQCTMGFSTNALPNVADPDNVDTLSVNLGESYGVLDAGNSTALAAGQPTCFLDCEIIAYLNETLTAPYSYDLSTTLRRGLFGSTIGSHAIGSQFCLLNGRELHMTVPDALLGLTVYFILQPFNHFFSGSPDLSTLPIFSYVVGTCPSATWPYPITTVTDTTSTGTTTGGTTTTGTATGGTSDTTLSTLLTDSIIVDGTQSPLVPAVDDVAQPEPIADI